ncbi:hypothetical protein [Enterococcus faecalis]|uniref:hypothetical protein n=1 Tax=Enterococcus faecalis TaxID=1351 RepID=UPI000366899D|nr:hypothetical protein [Enterococcus faecalis]EHM3078000.1 hypothetical protein [Enterococcus faecalis]EKE4891549.1 hypothetical protein [Enterococcus faecalis]EKL7558267.1 hypothetical protein [Enterococcus faecalis]EPH81730.1 hypothetical protein D924_02548 [Enterococcus faecalis 06-MB-S-10]EPH86974.1 hypothetical protein D923_02500 [Enterococcus faecalis 06-MB-S-04]
MLKQNYDGFSKDELIKLIEHQHLELVQKEAVCREYKKHLEEVIEHCSVEKYRTVVQK